MKDDEQKAKDEHAECVRAAFDWAMKAMPNVEIENIPGVLDSLAKLLREWFDSGRTSHEEKKKVYDEIEGMVCRVCGGMPKTVLTYCSKHIPPDPPVVDPATGRLIGIDYSSGPDKTVWIVMGVRTVEGSIDCDYVDKVFENEDAAYAHLQKRQEAAKNDRRLSYYMDDHEVEKD